MYIIVPKSGDKISKMSDDVYPSVIVVFILFLFQKIKEIFNTNKHKLVFIRLTVT